MCKKNGLYGFVDCKGKEIVACSFEMAKPFFEGLASVSIGRKIGTLNTQGNFVFLPIYDNKYFETELWFLRYTWECEPFNNLNGIVWLIKDNKWALAKENGIFLTDFIFEYFPKIEHKGLFIVPIDSKGRTLYGIIDKSSKVILDFEYREISFKYIGECIVRDFDENDRIFDLETGEFRSLPPLYYNPYEFDISGRSAKIKGRPEID